MTTPDLNGSRKAAILLLALGEEGAAEVMKHLNENEIRAVTARMNQFDDISTTEVERVMNEYYVRQDDGSAPLGTPETKSRYLRRVLSKSLGSERADSIVQGILDQPDATALEKLKWHAPRTIAHFIAKEHPQVIAVILATLDEGGQAERVLRELPQSLQSDVIERLAGLDTISQQWLDDIESTLADTMLPAAADLLSRDSAPQRVAEVLVTGSREMERAIMYKIEQKDPDLADRIREQMLRFEDFLGFDNMSLQKILHRATMRDLVLALRVADEALLEHVLNNLSENAGATLIEEMNNMTPARVSVVEAAQLRLINIARDLIDQEEIALLGKGSAIAV